MLLHHQRHLGRDHFAAVVVVDVQGGRRDGIAAGEEEVGEHAAVPLALVVADVAAAAERVDQPSVPAGLVRERARRCGRVVEGGDLKDGAVDSILTEVIKTINLLERQLQKLRSLDSRALGQS